MAIVGKGATIGKQYWVARDILREVEVSIKMIDDGRLVVIGLCKDKYRRFSTYSCYDQMRFCFIKCSRRAQELTWQIPLPIDDDEQELPFHQQDLY